MSSLSSLLTSLLSGQSAQTTAPTSKVYNTTDVKSVFTKADTDRDGHLTSTELNTFNNIQYFRYDPNVARDQEIGRILSQNFNQIAYRALKDGEATILNYSPFDSTIETTEIDRLTGFDGNSNTLTKADVAKLQNGNTNNWPTTTSSDPNPEPGPISGNTKQLLLLILTLLLRSLFGQQSGNANSVN